MLGPLCYPLLPALLDHMLTSAGCGIGIDVPVESLRQLQGVDILDDSSMGRIMAVEAQASRRVPIMLVADDQILPESCLKRLQQGASIASKWAVATGQQYHVATPDKTSVLMVGNFDLDKYNLDPVMLGGAPVPATSVKVGRHCLGQ